MLPDDLKAAGLVLSRPYPLLRAGCVINLEPDKEKVERAFRGARLEIAPLPGAENVIDWKKIQVLSVDVRLSYKNLPYNFTIKPGAQK